MSSQETANVPSWEELQIRWWWTLRSIFNSSPLPSWRSVSKTNLLNALEMALLMKERKNSYATCKWGKAGSRTGSSSSVSKSSVAGGRASPAYISRNACHEICHDWFRICASGLVLRPKGVNSILVCIWQFIRNGNIVGQQARMMAVLSIDDAMCACVSLELILVKSHSSCLDLCTLAILQYDSCSFWCSFWGSCWLKREDRCQQAAFIPLINN